MRLQVGRKRRRRKGMPQRVKRLEPFRPGQVWSMDFMHDSTVRCQKLWVLNIIDEASRQCLASIPEHGYPSWKLVNALDHTIAVHGLPQIIMTDNGLEFASRRALKWMQKHDVRHILIGQQAQSECLDRVVQRQDARGVPEPASVRGSSRCRSGDQHLTGGVQLLQATFFAGRSDTRRVGGNIRQTQNSHRSLNFNLDSHYSGQISGGRSHEPRPPTA